MLRFRRYRVFIICAIIITVLLLQVSRNSQWDPSTKSLYDTYTTSKPKPIESQSEELPEQPPEPPSPPPDAETTVEEKSSVATEAPPLAKETAIRIPQLKADNENKGAYGLPNPTRTSHVPGVNAGAGGSMQPTQAPGLGIPNRVAGSVEDMYRSPEEDIHIMKPPGGREDEVLSATTAIHWQKMLEWFPVPDGSLIQLPTGKPVPMPSIQHDFADEESAATKEKRESRLAQVKAEMNHAWSGYKEYAWTHDELRPVQGSFRDPFCGWAATLVDSLDTLWIMGMKDEFEEATRAVAELDFTTTPHRVDIPVFETTIRYLGGLLGAYDVSGGHSGGYTILLDKAIELGEILMGIFDTPNRMPILYYQWRPAFASQPQRAPTTVSVAEIGSMAMEFTRLAQLTGESKYYDGIARITDALEDLQSRIGVDGTALEGIFPQDLDASGCNKTATAEAKLLASSDAARIQVLEEADLSDPQGYSPGGSGGDTKPKDAGDEKMDIEFKITPGSHRGDPATGQFSRLEEGDRAETPGLRRRIESVPERDVEAHKPPRHADSYPRRQDPRGTLPSTAVPLDANGLPVDWDCVPQNLTRGGSRFDSYSMAGSQDSTYEYFPKQYLLLGGLVPKYRTMHEKVVAAVKKHLLFRPMTPDDRDILFSAKATSRDGTADDLIYEYELPHLVCFLGGMFAMGGKLFDNPKDVEIGAKLADGCVWAYGMFPSGLMPEFSLVMPCEDASDCHWNQTEWHRRLDPSAEWREEQMAEYHKRMAHYKEKLTEYEREKALRKEAEERAKEYRPGNSSEPAQPGESAEPKPEAERSDAEKSADAVSEAIERKVQKLEQELSLNSAQGRQRFGGKAGQIPLPESRLPVEPVKPLTHDEYVQERIEREHLPPGFLTLQDRKYILRPEAIESVWYLYRITGDPAWQEKGWTMFEAVINATRTEIAHSAVDDVAFPSGPKHTDKMESFWLAETLKYFYLLFATPDVISLDEWVLNTEAHPFRRPQ